jgi:glutamate racemase
MAVELLFPFFKQDYNWDMNKKPSASSPIGIYDSGVGGLTVLRAVRELLPHENLIYFADQAKVPYGNRPLEEVRSLGEGVTHYLMDRGAKLIVIACNTASAASLKHLRALYPDFPFVGMEPAVKPAVEQTLSGKVGVLATPSTFQGELYASVVERFAHDVQLFQNTCPGLVQQIEKGYLDTPKTRRILEEALEPMLREGVDTLVMGCTHFPFVIPLIRKIAGEDVRVIDPAPAVARQVKRVLEGLSLSNTADSAGETIFLTSAEPHRFEILLQELVEINATVKGLHWNENDLIE